MDLLIEVTGESYWSFLLIRYLIVKTKDEMRIMFTFKIPFCQQFFITWRSYVKNFGIPSCMCDISITTIFGIIVQQFLTIHFMFRSRARQFLMHEQRSRKASNIKVQATPTTSPPAEKHARPQCTSNCILCAIPCGTI